MKKTLKTLLCMLLCLSALLAFTGCETAASREAAVRTTAENYLTAVCALDMQTASTYTLDAEAFLADLDFKNAEDAKTLLRNGITESAGVEFSAYSEKFNPIVDAVIGGIQDNFSYEITAVTADGNGYIVSGTLTQPDFDADFDKIFSLENDAMNEILERVVNKVLESGQVTENTSEEELLALMVTPLVEELTPVVEAAMEKLPTIKEDFTLPFEKAEGAWLINDTDNTAGHMGISDFLD